jgi:hypothetical protein
MRQHAERTLSTAAAGCFESVSPKTRGRYPNARHYEEAEETALGVAQCDLHNRKKNDEATARMATAHTKLVMKFSPFIRLSDEKLEPVKLMETVADRLWLAAKRERQRRVDACPEGFEHLMEGAIKQ